MNTINYPAQKSQPTLALAITIVLASCSTLAEAGTAFIQQNLVTDDQSVNTAQITDTNLKNAWGIAYGPGGPFWLSDNATGVSTVYSVNPTTNVVAKVELTVNIPGDGSITGQVFNNNASAFSGDVFIFVSEDGTISGWGGGSATLQSAAPANVYKGVAEAVVGSNSYLYAANFRANSIDVIAGSNGAPLLTGHFSDPNLPAGFAPFDIQNLGGNLFVTYAKQDATKHDDVAGLGNGYVDEFNTQGELISRIASQGSLDSPWGLAIAPSSFGQYAGDLLVGNFGDGKINAYNLLTHNFVGQLAATNGQALAIDGLWALSIGNDSSAGSSQKLYFTAGPNGETNGLFGSISAAPLPAPLPASLWLFNSAVMVLVWLGKRKTI
ncbi:TIGR03118 family protein [Methylomonas paludis]|uniref:TIGR03118 family protein n=1 Tax=Methylomonas paludis TaxID=1173101 RepID=A0A975MRM9_9GAMM|nr:TIGR03118 family protein [Methylomonas paludis]QWF72281.1 TIGR03118 family protein [Methylomonas paludis]